jgi:hypothetical protein
MSKTKKEFKGWYYDVVRNLYRVKITINGVRKSLGSYPNHWEAEAVYSRAKAEETARKEKVRKEKMIKKIMGVDNV